MEKLLKILGLFLLPAFVLTSCSNDPESAGEDAGELLCDCWEKTDEYNDMFDDITKLEWKKEDDREEYADLTESMHELAIEIQGFENEKDEIELGQWDEQEKKNDQLKWYADYMSSLAEYADNNCDKFEDVFGYNNIDALKEDAKWANEVLKNK
tara:strand:+ start:115 stop:576 length:462 start_codon:yes stop_codon:yes gene_type:complete